MSDQDAQSGPVKREFANELVRLADIVPEEGILNGFTFVRCRILGPAVLWLDGDFRISGCDFGGTVDTLIWTNPPGQWAGAVHVVDCGFLQCDFLLVGVTGNGEALARFRASFAAPNVN